MITRLLLVALLFGVSATANAYGIGGYVGGGVGIPSVAYGTSSLGYKIFGGYKVYEFTVPKAGAIDLAAQGEYINFGSSSYFGNTYTQSGLAVDARGSWTIPAKWAGWADEKLSVLGKVGMSRVSLNTNFGYSTTYTGVTEGIGAEYRVLPMLGIEAMAEYYPGAYDIYDITAVFNF